MKALTLQSYIQCLCLYLGTILPLFSPAQVPFQNPHIRNTSNGLPADRVSKIVRDHRGFTWIGTNNGLCRFDGSSTQVFQPIEGDSTSIANEIILDLLADSATGKIWVATLGGLSVYNYQRGIFKNYRHQPNQKNGPPEYNPYRLHKDPQGTIWISFRAGGLYRYRAATDDFARAFCIPANDQPDDPSCHIISEIEPDHFNDSILWLGSNGIFRFNRFTGEARRYFLTLADKNVEGYANGIRCLFSHRDGLIYYGTWYEGVFVLDPRTGKYSRFSPACKPPGYHFDGDVVNGFYPKSNTQFWINSLKGLQLYDSEKKCVLRTWKNDLEKKMHYSVELVDEDQRIWSATYNNGVAVHNPLVQQFRTNWYESPETNLMCLTRKILEDTLRKKLYVLAQAGRGLYVLDQLTGKWSLVPPPAGYVSYAEKGFSGFDMTFLSGGSIFIVENSHFYQYDPGAARLRLFHLQPGQGNYRLRKVQKDHLGYLWVTGYSNALHRIDPKLTSIYSYEKDLLKVWKGALGGDHIEEDIHGNIWMREHNGLLIYKRAADQFVYLPYKGGSTNTFRGMGHIEASPYNSDIWIASNNVFMGYANADSVESGILRQYTKADGLVGNKVWMVKLLGEKLLVFTDEALQWFDTKTRRFGTHYNLEYGLGQYDEASALLSSGVIAVGKRKSIAYFNPEQLIVNQELPIPYVTAFKIFDKPWERSLEFDRQDTVSLSHRQNFFSFEFSSIAYNLSSDIQYLYKLEGFDEDWQDGTHRKFAAYTNVPGGDYQFKLKALNSEGLAFSSPYVLNIHISTVWYKTWWFWALAGLALFGAGMLAYRYRIGQVRKEERLKTDYERRLVDAELGALRAQMNPHFIFNSLNSIEYYIINSEPEKASDYLNRFSRLIRLILQNSKSTVVPLKDDLEALRLYIEMESMRFDRLFDYEMKVEKGLELEQYHIPPMLFQPYVENAIWHGLMQKKEGKGKLDLLLRRENGHLLCVIEDNGIGREAASQLKSKTGSAKKSFGMKITGDRLSLLNKISNANASVRVLDLKNEEGHASGTRVELLIPV